MPKIILIKFQNKLFFKKEYGFTLIELLVAIALMSILTVVAIPNYRTFVRSQSLSKSSADLLSKLRTVQTNAVTSALCPNGNYSKAWYLQINGSGYSWVPACVSDLLVVETPSKDTHIESQNYETGTQVSFQGSASGSCTSADTVCTLVFTKDPSNGQDTIKYCADTAANCDNSTTSQSLINQVSIKVYDGSVSQVITVDPGGSISLK